MHLISLESIAVISGLCNIYFAARAHILNWLFGIIMVSLYFVIFLQTKLYADMSLQLIFLLLQFFGAYQWLYGSKTRTPLTIQFTPKIHYLLLILSAGSLFGIISWVLATYTDSTTIYIDALTTALSLIAQWMMSKKWLEHWWVWIVVDLISIKMYLGKELYFTSSLYFIFLLCCLYGYLHWKKSIQTTTFNIPY